MQDIIIQLVQLFEPSPFLAIMGVGTALVAGTTFVGGVFANDVTVWQAAIQAAVAAGAQIALQSLTDDEKEGEQQAPISDRKQDKTRNVKQSIEYRRVVYGQDRVGGPIVYVGSSGSNDQYLHMVVAHASHKCNGITEVWLNDNKLSLDSDGFDTTGKFGDKVRVKKHLGSESQTADSDLTSDTSDWDDSNRLRGICYTYTRLEWDREVFGGIGIPTINVVLEGKTDIYDPRDGLLKYTNNPALCINDYLQDGKLGMGVSEDEINTDSVKVAANECDETVDNNDGSTESRYKMDGSFKTDREYRDIIKAMLTSMAGTMSYSTGQFHLSAGAFKNSGVHFSEKHVVSSLNVRTERRIDQSFNSVRGQYVDPDSSYQTNDFPPVQNNDFIIEDGETKWDDIVLEFTQSATMAQRIARIKLRQNRRPIEVSTKFNMKAYQVKVGDVVELSSDRMGWDKKQFEVIEWSLSLAGESSDGDGPGLAIDVRLKETDSDVFQNQQESLKSNTNTVSLREPTDPDMPGNFTVTDDPVVFADGSLQPRFKLEWNKPSDRFVELGGFYQIQMRKSSNSDWERTAALVDGDTTTRFINDGIEDGVSYDFRIRSVNVENNTSGWFENLNHSSSGNITIPEDPSSLVVGQAEGVCVAEWDSASDDDLSHYKVSVDSGTTSDFTLSDAEKLDENDSTRYYIPKKTLNDKGYSGTITFAIQSVDRGNNRSVTLINDFTMGGGSWNRELLAENVYIDEGTDTYSLNKTYETGMASLSTAELLYSSGSMYWTTNTNSDGQIVGIDVTDPTDSNNHKGVVYTLQFYGLVAFT